MALFDKKEAATEQPTAAQATPAQAAQATDAMSDEEYLKSLAGQGLDTIDSSMTSTAYLSMVQPDSSYKEQGHALGTVVNSATGTNLGNKIRVIPLAVATVWVERSSVAPYTTIGRYPPNSIEVRTVPVPAGQRGFPKKFNKATDNEIEELYSYALVLVDSPDTIVFFNPTAGSMRACTGWNSLLLAQRSFAPIFGYVYELEFEEAKKSATVARDHTRLKKATRMERVPRAEIEGALTPMIGQAREQSQLALAAPTADDGVVG